MNPVPIEGCTRRISAPANWDHSKDGLCHTLEIVDMPINGINYMVSAWMPSPAELEKIKAGGHIFLFIAGHTHPVVSLTVEK